MLIQQAVDYTAEYFASAGREQRQGLRGSVRQEGRPNSGSHLNIGLNMTSTARGWFRDLSIETKMLAIILPLVAIPMIVLGSVGYVVSAGQATTSGARYLKERASDLYTISENPSIRDYYENRYYDLLEEAAPAQSGLELAQIRPQLQFSAIRRSIDCVIAQELACPIFCTNRSVGLHTCQWTVISTLPHSVV